MESQSLPHGQIIETSGDVHTGTPSIGGSLIRTGATCGFSDSKASFKDAKERLASMKKLLMAVALCIVFMGIEVAGGIKANSLAILTDAAHLLLDVAAFAISLFSLWAAGWEATPRQSYGFFRIEILGALVSVQLIWVLAGILVYEAIDRLIHDTVEVQGFLMFIVATFGLLINIVMALVLGHDHGHGHTHSSHDHGYGEHGIGAADQSLHGDHKHEHGSKEICIATDHHCQNNAKHKEENSKGEMNIPHVVDVDSDEPLLKPSQDHHKPDVVTKKTKRKKQWNINVQGAYLHVLGDSLQSIGVMIGGAIIWYKPEWKIIDLICTLIFSIIVLGTTIKILRSILDVLMESTPREIDATKLEKGLCRVEGVVAIHELHIWAITVGKVLLACHVTVSTDADADTILNNVIDYIRREYNIRHVTIQIERQLAFSRIVETG